jgi:hypothetical protein
MRHHRRLIFSRRTERGGVVAVTAAVLGVGALLSMGALVVDVGQLYAEREQLQSGADAAALALARECAIDQNGCADQVSTAVRYADDNANDRISAVSAVCGTAPGLSPCPPPGNGLSACLGTPPIGVPYVEVRTETELANGRTILPATFASTITGMAGYAGRTLNACARAAYGTPATLQVAAVTVSQCEWTYLTGGGTQLPPPPRFAAPSADAEGVIYLHDPHGDNPSNCPTLPGGMTAPGGFGWLDDSAGSCGTVGTVGGSLGGDPGNNTSSACASALQSTWTAHGTQLFPIFDSVSGNGANTTYHIVGFSVFALTGYHLSGLSAQSWLSHRDLCTGSERCLYGYFSTAFLVSGQPLVTTNYGASAVTLIG